MAVEAHWSALATLGLFVTVLATTTLPAGHPGESRLTYWLVGVATAVVFLISLLAHELAHALVARHHGVAVYRITLWLLGGVTQLQSTHPSPRVDALVAAAGPATSLAIGAVTGVVAWWLGSTSLLGTATLWLATVSLLLGVFNLLPGAPLDGGRLVRAIAWARTGDRERAELLAARLGRGLGYVLVFLGLLETLAGVATGLWLVLLGWFILSGARAEVEAAGAEHLTGFTAEEVMSPVTAVAADWLTLPQLIAEQAPALTIHPLLPVVDVTGRVTGVITLRDLESVPGPRQQVTRVRDLAARHRPPLLLTSQQPIGDAVDEIRHRGRIGVVVDGARPIGVVTAAELTRAVHLSLLGWRGPRP